MLSIKYLYFCNTPVRAPQCPVKLRLYRLRLHRCGALVPLPTVASALHPDVLSHSAVSDHIDILQRRYLRE